MIWYEEDVQKAEHEIEKLQYLPQTIFFGSSSIRLWETLYTDLAIYLPINLGFGGSTLESCVYFFNRIMKPYTPQTLIIYAGDNDLGDGKSSEAVQQYFLQLCDLIYKRFHPINVAYISIKPSIARWKINDAIIRANALIKQSIQDINKGITYIDIYSKMLGENGLPVTEYYTEDGLHLSKNGYAVWETSVLTYLSSFNVI